MRVQSVFAMTSRDYLTWRRYETLGVDFNAPEARQDGQRSVAGLAAYGSIGVELVGPAADLTAVTVLTPATESHAHCALAPALVEGLQFDPARVEESIDAMLTSLSRSDSVPLSGVNYPVVGELRLAREAGLLTLTVEAPQQ